MVRLLGIEGVQIVGLCDTAEASLKASTEAHAALAKVPQFTDYREMLEEIEMDAVEISTPHTAHFEQIMASLDKDLHVLTEKPMVCEVEHAKDIIARLEGTDLVMGVSYQRPYMAPYRYCRAKITGGGSGGTVAVLTYGDARQAVDEVASEYAERTGNRPHVFEGSSPGAVAWLAGSR